MTYDTSAALQAAGGAARPDARIESDPPPFPSGEPPPELWCEYGTPPNGFTWLGARNTVRGWLYPCPACCRGWVPLVPSATDERDYDIGPIGCSRGCGDDAIRKWHRIKIARPEPYQASERERRYARRVIENKLADAPDNPKRTAFVCAQWCGCAGLSPPVLLATVAEAGGIEPAVILDSFMIGLDAPARPRLAP
jgi:hypothetical protein